jgi:signal transduction histidine kinase
LNAVTAAEIAFTRSELKTAQLKAVITSQEEERRRFAADLHDGMGQMSLGSLQSE